jgi:putative ABC transport system substrate-binding protein
MQQRLQTITLLFAAALLLLAPRPAAGSIIGIISSDDMQYYQQIHTLLLDKISDFVEAEGIEIVEQKPTSSLMSYINSARKLKAIGSKVIVTYGITATLTTLKEVTDVPILFAGVYAPEEMKIGGKNATGISSTVSVETTLRYLKDITDFHSLGVLFSKFEKDSILQAREVISLEQALNFKTVLINPVHGDSESRVLQTDALLFTTSCAAMCHLDGIIKMAREKKIPSAALISGGETRGIICTMNPSSEEQATQLAEMVIKAYNGVEPATMPIRSPSTINLIINEKEATALGLKIPSALHQQATTVIE